MQLKPGIPSMSSLVNVVNHIGKPIDEVRDYLITISKVFVMQFCGLME